MLVQCEKKIEVEMIAKKWRYEALFPFEWAVSTWIYKSLISQIKYQILCDVLLLILRCSGGLSDSEQIFSSLLWKVSYRERRILELSESEITVGFFSQGWLDVSSCLEQMRAIKGNFKVAGIQNMFSSTLVRRLWTAYPSRNLPSETSRSENHA
jgi:hypothetical protein